LPRPASADAARLALLIGAATGLAAAELIVGWLVGGPQARLRAEAWPLLQVRPALLVLLAVLVSGWGGRWRLAAYLLFAATAGAAEASHLLRLGNHAPWAELGRGLALTALLLIPIDPALQMLRRRVSRPVAILISCAVAATMMLAPVRDPVAGVVAASPGRGPAGPKPDLLLMTALPIIWGEKGAFDPQSRPALAYRAIQDAFDVRPLDVLDANSLKTGGLLLLAQPRWLAPAELVALDDWVRAGGRALILTDPRLDWPSTLPLGDIRRPPPVGLLKPLLDHWGLRLDAGPVGLVRLVQGRRLVLRHPGRLSATTPDCRLDGAEIAFCRIGRGRAVVIADADLLHDDLWAAAGADGGTRLRRLADNPLVIAETLDRLAGRRRDPAEAPVAWTNPASSAGSELVPVLLPLLAACMAALAAAGLLHRRRNP